MSFRQILKANPYHDARGRFTSPGGASFTSGWAPYGSPSKRAKLLADPEARRLIYQQEIGSLLAKGVSFSGELRPEAGAFISGRQASKEQLAQAWDTLVGARVTPNELVAGMIGRSGMTASNLEKAGITLTQMSQEQTIRFELANGGRMHGVEVSGLSREFNLKTGRVYHEFLQLPRTERGGHATKTAFAHALPLYQQMGLKQVTLDASLEVGGYAWARYGFRLQKTDEVGAYFGNLRRNYTRLQGSLSPAGRAEVQVAMKALNAFQLKHMDSSGRATPGGRDAPHFASQLKLPKATADYRAWSREQGRPTQHTFTSKWLAATGFSGVLDLTDARALRRTQRYVARRHRKPPGT